MPGPRARKPRIPKHVLEAVGDVLGGLREFVPDEELLQLLLDPDEDDNRRVRATLKGKHGGDIQWSLGYLYAMADVYGVEPTELMR